MKFICWATAATAVFSVLMSSAAAPSADVSPAAVLPATVPSVDASPAAASPDDGSFSAQRICTDIEQITAVSIELMATLTVQGVTSVNALVIAQVQLFRVLSVCSEIHYDLFIAVNCSTFHPNGHFLSATIHSPSMLRSKCLRSIDPLNDMMCSSASDFRPWSSTMPMRC